VLSTKNEGIGILTVKEELERTGLASIWLSRKGTPTGYRQLLERGVM
jgi:hypothetical protein